MVGAFAWPTPGFVLHPSTKVDDEIKTQSLCFGFIFILDTVDYSLASKFNGKKLFFYQVVVA